MTNDIQFLEQSLRIQLADGAAGVAGGQHARGDVVHHHRTGTDDGVVADGHARHDAHIAAYPHIVAHTDGQRVLQPGVALGHVQRVARGVERAVGRDEHIVAKGHPRLVQNHQVEVGKEVQCNRKSR